MTGAQSRNQWSRLNDAAVLAEMGRNAEAEDWAQCRELVQFYVQKQFPNLSPQFRDDVVQDTMLAVCVNIATFRFQSKFTTWVVSIAYHRAIDALRRQGYARQWEAHPENALEPRDTVEISLSHVVRTPEEIVLTNEQIRAIPLLLEQFLQMHGKSERNRRILQMALFNELSHEEIAQRLGVPAPVIGYVVRQARSYLRQELNGSL